MYYICDETLNSRLIQNKDKKKPKTPKDRAESLTCTHAK